jgi:type IV pilus assembly protein PilV
MSRSRSIRAAERGITMVEALVALVVLSVGMLGIASLFVASLQADRTALVRTQAVNLVNDMIDRIRANPAGRSNYKLAKGDAPKDQKCVGGTDNCSTSKLAQDDLYHWVDSTKGLPGNAVGTVTYTAAAAGMPETYVVRVEWTEPGDTNPLFYQSTLSMIGVIP